MTSPEMTVTVRLSPSALDHRRGVVRLHPEVLDALGLRAWDTVRLVGTRVSAALAAPADVDDAPAVVLIDDLTMSNLGVTEGSEVVLSSIEVAPAKAITVAGSRLASSSLHAATVRSALIGKVLTVGDAVSLLPQDLAPGSGSDAGLVRGKLSSAIGMTWTNELLTVTEAEPSGPVAVVPSTVVRWRGQERISENFLAAQQHSGSNEMRSPGDKDVIDAEVIEVDPDEEVVPLADLVGAQTQANQLREWLDLSFRRPELLARLGAPRQIGVVISGPEGIGKTTLAQSVAASENVQLVTLRAPNIAALEPAAAVNRLQNAIAQVAKAEAAALLITEIDLLLPATQPSPVATVIIDELRSALQNGLSIIATTAHPESVDPRVTSAELLERELVLPLPDGKTRAALLTLLLRGIPIESNVDVPAVAERTPGFVAADLVALRREAALRAALRQRATETGPRSEPGAEKSTSVPSTAREPRVSQQDLLDASETVRPISASTSDILTTNGLTLDDVGGLTDIKQSLTEAVLWPLRYPDSFSRLGVLPPRGVLLYGPPGGGKTFLVRALAGTGALNVFAVKGAELMDKWVGESERAVRELFRRATEAAPSLIFLDEIDALAPRRGQSSDSGVADRVVAALLTELDGAEPLREVIVLGATNRPELVDPALLRPGRLERLIYVAPPDTSARADILRANAKNTPLASDVDLDQLASTLDGYSAADCAALIREAALTAMRESLSANEVTAAHLAKAREVVRPSLDPVQLAALEAYSQK